MFEDNVYALNEQLMTRRNHSEEGTGLLDSKTKQVANASCFSNLASTLYYVEMAFVLTQRCA